MNSSAGRTILGILDDLRDQYDALIEQIREKNQALIDRDTDRLAELNEQQQILVEQIQQLNGDRNEFWQRVLSDRPGTRQSLTIEELVEAVPGLTRTAFRQRRTRLKQVLRDVQRLTRENMVLLENRLSVFENLFTALSGEEKPQTYDRAQQSEAPRTGSSVMIDREI